jgi:hypothetical protein
MSSPVGSAITVAIRMDPLVTAEDRVLGGMKVFVRESDLSLLSSKPSVRKVVPAAEEMNRVVYPETRAPDPMDPLVDPGAILVARMNASFGSVTEVASERNESFRSMNKAASEMSSRMFRRNAFVAPMNGVIDEGDGVATWMSGGVSQADSFATRMNEVMDQGNDLPGQMNGLRNDKIWMRSLQTSTHGR